MHLGHGTALVFERHSGGQWTPTVRIGELDEQTILVKGSTAFVAETYQAVFSATLSLYDLPPLTTEEDDE